MSDEISVPVSIQLDSDGFLRRQCPSCNGEFKWLSSEDAESGDPAVDQYFCPLCGQPAPIDHWHTPAQIEYAERVAAPQVERMLANTMRDALESLKGIEFKANPDFSLEMPPPDPLVEPDDMVIVEPPCHPSEPIKVPEDSLRRIHCLVCGSMFSA